MSAGLRGDAHVGDNRHQYGWPQYGWPRRRSALARVQALLRRLRRGHGRPPAHPYPILHVVTLPEQAPSWEMPQPPDMRGPAVVLSFRDGSSVTLDPATALAVHFHDLAAQLRTAQ